MKFIKKLINKPITQIELSFILSEHFKGFKKFPMVVYGNKEAEKNNALLVGQRLPGRKIVFNEITSRNNTNYFSVSIDGLIVGAIFDDSQIQSLKNGMIEKVYAKCENSTIIESDKDVKRNRIFLFVKFKEVKDGNCKTITLG